MTKYEIDGGKLCEYEAYEVPIVEVKKLIFRGTWKGSLEEEEVLYNLQHNLYSEEYKSEIIRLIKLNDDAEKWVKDNLETNALSFEETQIRKLAYFVGAETTRIEFKNFKNNEIKELKDKSKKIILRMIEILEDVSYSEDININMYDEEIEQIKQFLKELEND